jgi:hypothetical protein
LKFRQWLHEALRCRRRAWYTSNFSCATAMHVYYGFLMYNTALIWYMEICVVTTNGRVKLHQLSKN